VGPQKSARIRRLAGRWLTENRPGGWSGLRFDVISVRRTSDGPELTHFESAF
jgi:Holliday junction resolvase-like predicted endonuclease